MTRRQYDFADRLFLRTVVDNERLTDTESIFFLVASCITFISSAEDFGNFGDLFDIYNYDSILEAFDRIGHRPAVATLHLAHRIYQSSRSPSALHILASAFCGMDRSISAHLAAFQRQHLSLYP